MSRPVPFPATVDYPSSDGLPMAENDAQRDTIMYGIGALRTWFAGRRDVYVSGDLLIYYEEGDPQVSIAPDVFVVLGAANHRRMTYKLWEEPKAPDFVLEVASPSTAERDLVPKRAIYARLGVQEYWQYDPTGGLLPSRLMGWRMVDGAYEERAIVRSPDGSLTSWSETLGLDLWAWEEGMRFRDPATGRDLLGHEEEHAARLGAEARIAELEALLRDKRV